MILNEKEKKMVHQIESTSQLKGKEPTFYDRRRYNVHYMQRHPKLDKTREVDLINSKP